jgi:hypothetical protein
LAISSILVSLIHGGQEAKGDLHGQRVGFGYEPE